MKIRISALRAIVDLLLLFGFQLLSDTAATLTAPPPHSPDRQEEDAPLAEEKGGVAGETAQSALMMLSEFLDSEVCVCSTQTIKKSRILFGIREKLNNSSFPGVRSAYGDSRGSGQAHVHRPHLQCQDAVPSGAAVV